MYLPGKICHITDKGKLFIVLNNRVLTMKKLATKHMVFLLFALCWAVYFVSYLGRLNYSAAMTQLLEGGVLQKTQAGLISTLFFATYASGQLINGFLGDKMPPKYMMLTGMLCSAIMNLLMAFSLPVWAMAAVWAINGFAQSMIWPPIVFLFTNMLPKRTMVKCFTNLASTVAAGTLFSYLLSALMLKGPGWQWAFGTPGIILGIMALVFFICFPKIEEHRQRFGELEEDEAQAGTKAATGTPLWKILLAPSLLLFLLPSCIHGVLKDGLTAWIPSYINENFNAGPVMAVLASMVLPVVNLGGAYLASYGQKKLNNPAKVSAILFACAFLSLLSLWLWGGSSLWLCLAMLAICSVCTLAINTVFVSFVPISYASCGRSASVSGFLNATAYLGAALSSVGIGAVAQGFGWNAVFSSFVAITAIAFILCAIPFKARRGNADLKG